MKAVIFFIFFVFIIGCDDTKEIEEKMLKRDNACFIIEKGLDCFINSENSEGASICFDELMFFLALLGTEHQKILNKYLNNKEGYSDWTLAEIIENLREVYNENTTEKERKKLGLSAYEKYREQIPKNEDGSRDILDAMLNIKKYHECSHIEL